MKLPRHSNPALVTIPGEQGFGFLMPVTHPDLAVPSAQQWAMSRRRVAAARARCERDGEFWTAEKEAAALSAT